MSISVFLSTVTDEFRAYRDKLVHDLTRPDVAVKVQEDFKDLGGDTLDKLDAYIARCDAVVHLVGDMSGSASGDREQQALLAKYRDLAQKLRPLGEALATGFACPYTQWEAWLALYHEKSLVIAAAEAAAPRGPNYEPTEASRAAQAAHLARLKAYGRYAGYAFANSDDLAKQIALSAILDLLVKDYAEKAARERDVAEGFIKEMAKRVAGDKALTFDAMKQQVQKAIDIYEKEIVGQPTQTNIDASVEEALTKARGLVDAGKSALARAALRRAADDRQREEEERRKRYAADQTALYNRERDIALASYDGEAAGEAILALAEAIHGTNTAAVSTFLNSEADTLEDAGRDRGSNVHLVASIPLRTTLLALASTDDERGAANNNLGNALSTLGERESVTTRLEAAVAAFRAALREYQRERAPSDWAMTQNNLAITLATLGEREIVTARLEGAVAAYRAALGEYTREKAPVDWAMTQNNLGNALQLLGDRESGTARLEEAVNVCRAALEEFTRDKAPLDWAMTQENLGNALQMLGERESGTARLEEAVAACRAALEERKRDRAPLDWAETQNSLGDALRALGERESGTARLEEAVAACSAALEEYPRDKVPLDWATAQDSLGAALFALGQRESATARIEAAVAAYRSALQERTRERVPLDWARSQQGLANALAALANRQKNAALMDEALASLSGAVDVYRQAGESHRLPIAERRLVEIEAELAALKG
jgi:hypothetical protein